jgi:hypothetical protein
LFGAGIVRWKKDDGVSHLGGRSIPDAEVGSEDCFFFMPETSIGGKSSANVV